MKRFLSFTAGVLLALPAIAQTEGTATPAAERENIYEIKKHFLEDVLHNPMDRCADTEDNDLERFNRWFNFVEPRCYPTGNLPRPDVLLREYESQNNTRIARKTTATPTWKSVGPYDIPAGFFGVGRVNCIVIDPVDTHKLYIGAACGGVWISNNGGASWTSHTDNFPSLSVAGIAVNPKNTNILYAATGDGYGYETATASYNIFWGGLYSAGVMKSTDGGNTWTTTGLSYLQTNRNIIQKIIIHPTDTNILLAATRNGIYRTTNGGATWTLARAGHTFSMEFRPNQPDTVYAVTGSSFEASYDAGATWTSLASVGSGDRCTIAVSPAAPQNVWVLTDNEDLMLSTDEGHTFNLVNSLTGTIFFYGYYDRVLAVSPVDPQKIYAFGMDMNVSYDGGISWSGYDLSGSVHPDNHAIAINPKDPQTVYNGNDGGIFVTHDDGSSWSFINSGLAISQVYRLSTSRQNPGIMLAGLQDNGSFYNDGTAWNAANVNLGDGMDNAIFALDDNYQIASTQYGNFSISTDGGASFSSISSPPGTGYWTSPVVFHPRSKDTIYFGYDDVYASYDGGFSMVNLTNTAPFGDETVALAISQSDPRVLYAASRARIYRTTDGGANWTSITTGLFAGTNAITHIAIDYKNPMLVYLTLSGYTATKRMMASTDGGNTWTNITGTLPALPVNCVATDSSTRGAVFVGTDIGVYYRDSANLAWTPYGTGLPMVIVDDIDINYTNHKVRLATYGRGIWEADLKNKGTGVTDQPTVSRLSVKLAPNPAHSSWKVVFSRQPDHFTVILHDVAGREVWRGQDETTVEAGKLADGVYTIEVVSGIDRYTLKAVKN